MYYLLSIITIINLFRAVIYIWQLNKNINKWEFIYWDYMHSLQHIAISGITATLSIAMLFWVVSDYTLLIYLVYNASVMFIIYPHITSES